MQNSRHDVLLIDPKGLIGDINSETFKRHLKYSEILSQENSNARLIVFSTNPNFRESIYESKNFIILNYFNSSKIFYKKPRYRATDLARLNLEPKILISGEPFESFIYSLMLKMKFGIKIPIQLQIHFDPDQFKKSHRLLDKIKFLSTIIAILLCDSLRIVNKLQLLSIPSKIYISKKITICPLPVTVTSEEVESFNPNRPRNIGIFGRIHPERGLQTILESLSMLPSNFYNKVIVAGDGELKESFLSELKNIAGQDNVIYLGNLIRDHHRIFWESIGVLISFPEFEAYGISMRESICYGIPVLSTRTIGSELLATECSSNGIRILSNPTDAMEFMMNLEWGFSAKIHSGFMLIAEKESIENQRKLVLSWLYPT